MTIRYTLKGSLGERVVQSHSADFGLVDERGRAVGFSFTIEACEAAVSDAGYYTQVTHPGTWYLLRSGATRNGERYGALTNDFITDDLDAAKREGARRVDVALKRYSKKYGSPK